MTSPLTPSPTFDEPGAVAPQPPMGPDGDEGPDGGTDAGPDAAVPAHYGDPFGEQRALIRRAGVVDRSHRGVVRVSGPERLSWLHLLLTQQVADLGEGAGTEALVLDAQGRVEHHAVLAHVDDTVWFDVEPGRAAAAGGVPGPDALLVAGHRGRRVGRLGGPVAGRPRDRRGAHRRRRRRPRTATTRPRRCPTAASCGACRGPGRVPRRPSTCIVPRAELGSWWSRLRGAGARPAGHDAFEALRVGAVRPRLGLDTDERAIPHEMGWIGGAVHLHKGCYRGQETVSRVANLGRPPRQLVLLHLQAGDDPLPPPGTPVLAAEGGRSVGRIGSAVRHHELGTVALALLKRSAVAAASAETPLWVAAEGEQQVPGPAAVDPDSIPPDTGEPPGRAAMRRLQG